MVTGDMAPDVQWLFFLKIILASTHNSISAFGRLQAHSTTIMQLAVTCS